MKPGCEPESLLDVRVVSNATFAAQRQTGARPFIGTVVGTSSMDGCWKVLWDHRRTAYALHRSFFDVIEESPHP